MKVVKKEFSYNSRTDSIWYIIAFGDIHMGNRSFDEDKYYKTIDFIKKEPHTIVIGMGDYAECINAKDKRHDYNAMDFKHIDPDSQYAQITKDFMPIKDKIAVLLDGNHDYAFWQRHNHNYVDTMAHDLGVPYGGISSYLRFSIKRKSSKGGAAYRQLNIYAHHGWTGARTDAYKVKVIQDLSQIFPGLHLYLMGHVHQLGEAPATVSLFVDEAGSIREWTQKYVLTGSYIKGYEEGIGSYTEARGYRPTSLGSPIIEIKPNEDLDKKKDFMAPPFRLRVSALDFINGDKK